MKVNSKLFLFWQIQQQCVLYVMKYIIFKCKHFHNQHRVTLTWCSESAEKLSNSSCSFAYVVKREYHYLFQLVSQHLVDHASSKPFYYITKLNGLNFKLSQILRYENKTTGLPFYVSNLNTIFFSIFYAKHHEKMTETSCWTHKCKTIFKKNWNTLMTSIVILQIQAKQVMSNDMKWIV